MMDNASFQKLHNPQTEGVKVLKMENVSNALLDGILPKIMSVNLLMITVGSGKMMENVQVVIMDIT